MKTTFFAVLALSASTMFAADNVLIRCDAENNKHGIDGGSSIYTAEAASGSACYLSKGPARLTTLKRVAIKPHQKYQASLKVKAIGSAPAELYASWVCYDENGKIIPSHAFHSVPNSMSELAAPVKKGDKVIKIKSNAKWKAHGAYRVAFNAKDDSSDLPNNDVAGNITKVTANGDIMEVTLSTPAPVDCEKGSKVRIHLAGGDFQFFYGIIQPGEWKEIKSLWYYGHSLRKAHKVSLVLITNLNTKYKKSQLLFDDLQMVSDSQNVSF